MAVRMTIGGISEKGKNPGQARERTETIACPGNCGPMSQVDAGARRHVPCSTNAAGPVRRPVLGDAQNAVVVAVAVVGMVQVAGDEIVGVAAVLHRLVLAAVVVPVGGLVAAAGVSRRAGVGVRRRHRHGMLVDVTLVRVVQVAFVQIVRVAVMQHGRVAAIGAVPVTMIGMDRMCRVSVAHDLSPLSGR